MSGGGRSHLGMAMLLVVALAIGEAGASPSGYSGLVVFGDSLSDPGNAERYGVERIATRIGAELRPSEEGGASFAVRGARTHGGATALRAQADAFLKALPGGRADPMGSPSSMPAAMICSRPSTNPTAVAHDLLAAAALAALQKQP
jgi:hypothetical protein